jgi:hypothetical protein
MRRMVAATAILVSLGAAARAEPAAAPAQVDCARPLAAEVTSGERLVCDVAVDLRGEPAPIRRSEAEVVRVPKRAVPARGPTKIVTLAAAPMLGVWSGTAVLQPQAACAAAYPEVVAFPRPGAKLARRALPLVVEPQAAACATQG